jgi:epoxyqueuosine reductase
MSQQLKEKITKHLGDRISAIGFAPLERFADAPEQHHPATICKDAKTVIVFGITAPRGMLHSPNYNLHLLHRSYHTLYMHLDELAVNISNFIEAQGDHLAVPVPSYAPMIYRENAPWGLLSLKHAAVNAGLGAFGRSGQMYHPQYGSLLRLGAVVTSAEMPGDTMMAESRCPEGCTACHKVCPSKAFDENGEFNKLTCLFYSIKHAIYPLALKTEEDFKHIERIINTAGYNYWIKCDKCLKVCPLNKKPKSNP